MTFEEYYVKFSLIMQKRAVDSKYLQTPKKSSVAVNRTTHHWIIWNQKTKKISLVDKFFKITSSRFFY